VGEKMARFSLVLILLQIKLIASSVFYVNFPLETDTVLSSWVLKKYVDNNARFLPIDKLNTKNIRKEQTINTAKSYIRRNARFTAFEMALNYYKVSEEEMGYMPIGWKYTPNGLKEGEHILTINVSSFSGQVGVKHIIFYVEDNDFKTK
jgi:hypothetical protein